MPQVNVELAASFDRLRATADALRQSLQSGAATSSNFESELASVEAIVSKLAVKVDALASKQEKANERTKKKTQTDAEQAEALKRLADQAELTASRMGASGRSQELLIKIGGQYASILRETGQANSDLEKTWRAGLSPAENSARKLVELAAASDDARLKTEAYQIATGELSDRMADQIRRQDTNVGSQNKLSRSLSELIDELKAAQKGTLAVAVAQAEQAETSAHVALELRKLAFETNDAEKETEQYKATVGALQKRMEALTIQEQTNKLATEKSAEAYGQSKQRLDALETAMTALGIPGANLVQKGKEIADSLETMSEKGKKGETQLLKIAIAGGVAVASIAAVSAGFVAATAKAAEWDGELAKVGLNVDKLSNQQLKNNAAALEAVVVSGKALGVSLAQDVGDSVAYVAEGFTILNLALRDGWSKDLPAYGLEADKLNRRLADQIDLQERLKQQRQEQTDQLGLLLDQQKREYALSQSLQQQIQDEQLSRLTGEAKILAERDKRIKSIRDEFTDTYRYAAASAEAVENYERLKAEVVKSAEEQIRAERKASADEQLKTISVMQQRYDGTEAAVGNLNDAYKALAQAIVAADQADDGLWRGGVQGAQDYTDAISQTTATLQESADQAAYAYSNALSSLPGLAQQTFGAWADIAGQSAEKTADQILTTQKKLEQATTASEKRQLAAQLDTLQKRQAATERAHKVAFALEQAAAVSSIVMSTSKAIMAALTIPPPAGQALAGLNAALGAAQLAAVAQTTFGSGSIAAPAGGSAGGYSGSRVAGGQAAPTLTSRSAAQEAAPMNSNVARAENNTVTVTDAVYTASAGAATLNMARGDKAVVFRDSKMGMQSDEAIPLLERIASLLDISIEESRRFRQIVMDYNPGRRS